LKATNLLISQEKIYLIDLDGMRQYHCHMLFKRAWKKDMQRFMKNWKDNPPLYTIFEEKIKFSGL
jgi:hypothetical protein